MTHDELLAKIDNNYFPGLTHMEQVEEMVKQDVQIKSALRAVVELHKPTPGNDIGDSPLCEDCINTAYIEYPCDTIRAIEKELK